MSDTREARLPHPYTVDVFLYSFEPYPCIVCGSQRPAWQHTAWQAINEAGMVMVPVEPSDAMVEAGTAAMSEMLNVCGEYALAPWMATTAALRAAVSAGTGEDR